MAKVFNVTTSDNKKVEEFYEKAVDELEGFYGIGWNQNPPKIYLVPDRKTFNALYNKETEAWVVGSTMSSHNVFYVLSPESYEKESNHKYSDDEYFRLIKHELSHLYSKTLFDSYKPIWFNEGIAIYTSGQNIVKKKPKKFSQFLDFYDKGGGGVYWESGFAVEILINEMGKEKFLKALKGIKTPITEKSFRQYFKKNFSIDLTYDWFNERL